MGLRAASSFLTPIGGARRPSPGDLAWFPLVGLAIGAFLGTLWWAGGHLWSPGVAAAIVVTADMGVTGMLHLDGLADSADGLLPHLERSRRLEVMAEPQVGAFGVAVLVAVTIVRFAALGSMRANIAVLAGLWCLSRTAMAVIVRTQPPARRGGLSEVFRSPNRFDGGALALVAGAVVAVVILCTWRLGAGLAAASAGTAGAIGVIVLARRRLGGYTGDVVGAAGVVLETGGLIVASARW